MSKRIALIAGSVVALFFIGRWQLQLPLEPVEPPPQSEIPVRDQVQAGTGQASEAKPEAAAGVTASDAVMSPRVFGLNGPVRIEEVPVGRLRAELLSLRPDARDRALKKLGDQRVPLNDVASLRVDDRGYFYYECAPLATRLAPELSALSVSPIPVGPAEPVVNRASVPVASPPVRHSKPGSTKVIYLDFNGHTITGTSWNNSRGTVGEAGYRPAVATYVAKPFDTDGDTTTFSDAEQTAIVRIWERVAEDFKPFDVNVTTEAPVSFTPTIGRVLITDSVDANGVDMPSPNSAGVAYRDVFGDPDYVSSHSPAFVYADKNYDREHYIAETASHEMGHNLSLSHDGAGEEEYYEGHGYGETSWNSIMGGAFTEHVTQWSKGEYQNATNKEDDLAILQGHLGYATDDHADTNGSATALTINGQNFSGQGIIGQTGEADRFSFTATAGTITFTVTPHRSPANTHGGNLDVALELYDSANNLVTAASPSGVTVGTLISPVSAGTYYLRIYGTGEGSVLSNGYSNYGSLGQYSISSSFTAPTAPNITSNPSNQTVYAGQTAQFYAYAGGSPAPSFRWQRLPSGSNTWADLADDSEYAGTGTTSLSVTTTLAMSGDQFRCVASNLAGNANSNAATLTVQAATPPSIYYNPYSASITDGSSADFYCSATGTDPMSYRWQRLPAGSATWADLTDTGSYTGTTSSYLTIYPATLAMSGDQFRCVVSNAAGSATCNVAILTVTPVVPPSISNLLASVSVNYGESFSLFPTINGTNPFIVQWYKDGVAIPGATLNYFARYNCTQADSGSYTVKASNSAGSVTSSATIVTVNPVIAPVITQQPLSLDVAKGYSANFSVSASGSPLLKFQWYRNGQVLPFGTDSSYSINDVTEADGGEYAVKITNDGGSVMSVVAELVVLPALLPKITWWTSQVSLSSTYGSLHLWPGVSGTQPMTYQWYKDGIAIPGATSSTYADYSTSATSAGIYTLRVTNEAGLALSPDAVVTWTNSSTTAPWLDAVRLGDVVYFLAASPGRIMRYNLATESWLPITYLPEVKVPTAFLPTAEGVFVAYNTNLVRLSADLLTETPVATSTAPIQTLFAIDNLIYYQEGQTTRSRNRTTLAAGPDSTPGYYESASFTRPARPTFATSTRQLYTTRVSTTPNDIEKYTVAAGGQITHTGDSPFHGQLRIGSRQYMSPGDSFLFDNSGVIYANSTLDYVASLGRPFDDLVFLSNGTPVALRGQTLTAHGGSGYAESGQYQLSAPGYAIFGRGEVIFSFSAPVSNLTNPGVAKVASSSLVPASLSAAGSPANKLISIEDAFMDINGVIHLLSRSEKGIVRWDARNTRGFLPTLPLRAGPLLASYAPALDRLALVYGDGALTDLFPGSDTDEQIFGNIPMQNVPFSLVTMDELTFLNIRSSDSSADHRIVLGPLGELKTLTSWSYWGVAQAWQSSNRRLYSLSSFSYNNAVEYVEVPGSGALPFGATATANNIIPPLRFNADGTLILTSSRVLNADLQQIGTLANSVADGVWLPNSLFTIRVRPNGTEVQRWARITYEKTGNRILPGIPLRIFRIDDSTLAVVTTVKGYIAVHVVNAALELVSSFVNDSAYVPMRPATFDAVGYLAGNPDVAAAIGEVSDKFDRAWSHYYTTGIAEGRTDGDFSVQAYLTQYADLLAIFGSDLKGAALQWYQYGRQEGRRIPVGFDVEGYLTRNSDVAAAFGADHYAAWLHFQNSGINEGRVYDDFFLVDEYLELYADLKATYGTNRKAALMHWLTTGKAAGRLGRVPKHFDADAFLRRYSDLSAAYGSLPEAKRKVAVWNYYLDRGAQEGRNDGEFIAADYLADHPDLKAAFGTDVMAAAVHWYVQGRYEGRRIPPFFSVAGYFTYNPDVADLFGADLYGGWLHYRDVGVIEGHSYNEEFRVDEYIAMYPDLQAAFGTDRRSAMLHWLQEGRKEERAGRVPTAFDHAGYFTRNPDVAASLASLSPTQQRISAWTHFFYNGVREGRNFDALFRVNEYLALYPDLQAAYGTKLGRVAFHWLIAGKLEGRRGRF